MEFKKTCFFFCIIACAWFPLTLMADKGAIEDNHKVPDTKEAGFWSPLYLMDYGIGAGGLYLELTYRGEPRAEPLMGPAFDPENPAAILDPKWSDLLGRPFMAESEWTIPNLWLEIAAYGQLLIVPAHELIAGRITGQGFCAHRMHHSMLAVFQATAVNAGMSRVVKAYTGRLRPDFQERTRYVYCSMSEAEEYGIDCSGLDSSRFFHDDEEALLELREGRYSFVSGHASNAMLVATNLALQTGGLWVWGENADSISRGAGIGAMTLLYGFGLFSGISRTHLMDGVHHTSDVVAGSITGVLIGNLFYWLHFDTGGNPRNHHWLKRLTGKNAEEKALSDLHFSFTGNGFLLTGAW